MKFTLITLIIIALSCTLFISCKNDTDDIDINFDAQVHFVFSHHVGSETLAFDTIKYTNAAGNNYSVSTLRYFVSDFVLTKDDGSKVTFDEIHYIDGTDESTFTFDPKIVTPAGEYTSLSFVFGLTEANNVTGAFVNPPDSNMEWPIPLGGGYHYMKLEGKFDSTALVKNYQAHFGRLMTTPNFININYDSLFLLVLGTEMTVECKMNINNWWTTPNTLDLNIMSGIMQNETIQHELHENGADIFTFKVY